MKFKFFDVVVALMIAAYLDLLVVIAVAPANTFSVCH